ncbi:MAG: DUF1501 domain-containing protein [Sulfitobacter sp.]|nr:DUF1501 domain-containing protein [Sulfitobacter sp.]
MTRPPNRRDLLRTALGVGCSLAASPLVTPMAFASAPWDSRLVVIILRGGMDGLDVVRPVGDPAFAALRPTLDAPKGIDLDGYFELHPALAPLLPLWQREELGFVHAVSTPYRDKRSHFDGQDLLEAGTDSLSGAVRDGWLNRMLQARPGMEAETAYAIGNDSLAVLEGAAPVANWAPEANLRLSPQALRLAELVMEPDAPLHAAFAEALSLSQEGEQDRRGGRAHEQIARFAAARLRGASRVAAFSLGGWDTHRAQNRALSRSLSQLTETLLILRGGLGPEVWDKTAVIAMTEFGRTARANGTGGTDHGTGGLMLLAGGRVRGGQVHGRWPGLDEASLYDRRDLMPTGDVRTAAAAIMQGLTGLDRTTFETSIFPGIDMAEAPDLLR